MNTLETLDQLLVQDCWIVTCTLIKQFSGDPHEIGHRIVVAGPYQKKEDAEARLAAKKLEPHPHPDCIEFGLTKIGEIGPMMVDKAKYKVQFYFIPSHSIGGGYWRYDTDKIKYFALEQHCSAERALIRDTHGQLHVRKLFSDGTTEYVGSAYDVGYDTSDPDTSNWRKVVKWPEDVAEFLRRQGIKGVCTR